MTMQTADTAQNRFSWRLAFNRAGASLASGGLLLIVGAVSDVFRLGTHRFLLFGFLCLGLAVVFFLLLSFDGPANALLGFADRFGGRMAFYGALGYGLFMSIAVILLYYQFDTWIDFDLSLRNQAFWRVIHGGGFVSTMDSGINNLGIHSAYVYFLVLPVYALFPYPPTLMVCQAVAVALGGFLLFRCLRTRFNSEIAIGITLAYWMSAMVSAAVFHGVHEVTFGAPFIVLMYDSFLREKLRRFLVWTFLILTVKETMPFVVAGFMVLAIVKRRSWKWWAIPASMAAVFAVVNFGVVFPMLRARMGSAYMGLDFLPKSPGEWLAMAPGKMRYVLALLAPFLLLGPARAYSLPALFEIGINMISMNPAHTDLNRHYAIYIGAAFLVSSAFAIDAWSRSPYLARIAGGPRRAALWLVIVLVLSQAVVSPLWTSRLPSWSRCDRRAEWAMVDRIPAGATVMASHGFLAALSSRKKLFSFYNTYDKLAGCDYLMIDGAFVPEWYPSEARRKISRLSADPWSDSLFEPIAIDGPYMLMRRK